MSLRLRHHCHKQGNLLSQIFSFRTAEVLDTFGSCDFRLNLMFSLAGHFHYKRSRLAQFIPVHTSTHLHTMCVCNVSQQRGGTDLQRLVGGQGHSCSLV